jgi:diguanylate cyclase (GGDEF)-like protein
MFLDRAKQTNLNQSRQLGFPALIVGMLVGISMVVYGLITPLDATDRLLVICTGIFGGAYAVAFLLILIPLAQRRPHVWWLVVTFHSLATVWLLHLEPINLPGISLVTFATFLLASAVLMGRGFAYLFAGLTLLLHNFIPTLSDVTFVPLNLGTQAALFLASAVLIETIHLYQGIIRRQVRRLEILNQMTRNLAYSIEMKQVISLMSEAIQSTLNADTYLIGFLEEDAIRLELFYDENEFFQGMHVPLKGTLAGKVIQQRKPVFLNDTSTQRTSTGLEDYQVLGKPRFSLSWMGTPLQVHHHVFGVAAVASYHKNAFNSADLDLLENFAQQASIALDNASHHAEVEQKSTQDSLTRVLNHGNFLEMLIREAQKSALHGYPISLIMLDVDYFKTYNDQFGHIVGDRVLVQLAELVRRFIKSSDLIGRWGGEEFAIALPNTTAQQAAIVAERIRTALHKIEFVDRNGACIPSPTISQGIAELPTEASQAEALIDLADQRLYVAKNRGRDQIEPPIPTGPGLEDPSVTLD